VKFERELAIVACRSTTGEFSSYPLVVTEQRNGICFTVTGPAIAVGVNKAHESLARSYAQKLGEKLDLHGVFAIELFETASGEVFVNEIAPRVHNSGHCTQNSALTSQFENHWRAVLGMPLGSVDSASGFAMVNLLGPEKRNVVESLPATDSRMHLHWYGKKESRPRRKLGHLNGVVEQSKDLASLVQEMKSRVEAWEKA
jgi:5-(carboxyamino)imidazole ribonucleotide synthase